ncbi:MAG: biotin/lipoyl-binding protein, partial [Pseudomonadota bacterium]
MKTVGLIAALLAVLAGGWWYASRSGPLAAAQQIETVTADRGDITQLVSSTGSVRALISVEVGSQLSGQIAELYADFNTPVKAGDLLALIDPQTFERRVQEAEANLAIAQANVAVEAAGILRAQASLDNATLEFDRQRSLVERGAASQAVLDTAQATFD